MSSVDAIATIIEGEDPGWTPSRLIEVFCAPGLRSSFAVAARRDATRSDWHSGFCSYNGKDAYGAGIDGFDDGHDLWGALTTSGWVLVMEPGDEQFPFAFRMAWARDGAHALIDYCEGDFGVELFDDLDALKAGVAAFQKWATER
jgi:hypothetical protein